MTSRRGFLAGLLASSLAPTPSWADLGRPAFLTAAKNPDGSYLLAGLSEAGAIQFTCPPPPTPPQPMPPQPIQHAPKPLPLPAARVGLPMS